MFDLIYPREDEKDIVVLYNQLEANDEKSGNLCKDEFTSTKQIFAQNPTASSNVALVKKTLRPNMKLASPLPTVPGRLHVHDID